MWDLHQGAFSSEAAAALQHPAQVWESLNPYPIMTFLSVAVYVVCLSVRHAVFSLANRLMVPD